MVRKLVIAISGPPGVGSSSVAKNLAKRLNLKYFSPGKYFKSYSEGKETKQALDVWKSRLGRSKEFHKKIDKIQINKAKVGDVVICGKLSIYILKNFAKFKFWLDAPLTIRAERAAFRDKISKKDALKLLKRRERMERKEWKRIYRIDYFSQKEMADLVIDTSNKSLKMTVDEILNFILKIKRNNQNRIKTT